MKNKQDIIKLFPDLFELDGEELYFKNRRIFPCELDIFIMSDQLVRNYGVYPKTLAKYMLNNRDYGYSFSQLNLSVHYYVNSIIESSRSGELEFRNWVDLTARECMDFFNHDIEIKYSEINYDKKRNAIGVTDHYYDREAIMRKYSIENIIG